MTFFKNNAVLSVEMGESNASSRSGVQLLLLAGAITTALSLTGVYLASQAGHNIMGWYANYLIPVGALVVGLGASSGFGMSSWHTGTRIGGGVMAAVMTTLIAAYFVAQYLEFRQLYPEGVFSEDGTPLGFGGYFDLTTRAFHWAPENEGDTEGSPFGVYGYLMRALEILGFVLGGLAVPLVLRHKPYCDPCGRYKRTRQVGLIPAGVRPKKVSKRKPLEVASYEQSAIAAGEEGYQKLDLIMAAAGRDDNAALLRELATCPSSNARKVNKLTSRILVELIHCPTCLDGTLHAATLSGRGKQTQRAPIGDMTIHTSVVASLAGSAKLPKAKVREVR